MPFTIGGEWTPGKGKQGGDVGASRSGPVKVRVEKRRNTAVTVVLNFSSDPKELKQLANELKRICASGGTVKEGKVEVQGDQKEKVVAHLSSKGINVK